MAESTRSGQTLPDDHIRDNERVLLVPAVAVGNIGQLAIDVLCNALKPKKFEHIDHQGCLLPCVGRVGLRSDARIATSCELHELTDHVSCLYIRSMVVPGRSREFARVILGFAKERGFDRIVVLGGASALALINDDQLTRTRDLCRLYELAPPNDAFLPLEYDIKDLKMTGMLRYLREESTAFSIPLSALLFFVFEGDNAMDGQRLAGATMQVLRLQLPASTV